MLFMEKYDILLKNGHVKDPVNKRDGIFDIGIINGKIAQISSVLPSSRAKEIFDLTGKYIIPGIVDMHSHVTPATSPYCHRMLASAGVTATIDMAGPIEESLKLARDAGAGLTLASIDQLTPGYNISTVTPSKEEIEKAIDYALEHGSLGIKILAGLQLLDPNSIGQAFQSANDCHAYVAVHCGSSRNNSNIEGFLEAVELAGNNRVHIAHINTYCRGLIKDELLETIDAIDMLKKHPNVRSESYLSPLNGNWATCENGIPKTPVCKNCLRMGGYPETQEGLKAAILDGWAKINVFAGGKSVLMTGPEAVDYWLMNNTKTGVSFSVNSPIPRYLLATAKRPDNTFVCDAISTDGGGIPRNVIISQGLSLIKFGALTWDEYILKTSINPAKILGLINHGSLGIGCEANITAVDFEKQIPELAISNGKLIMYRGYVCGNGTRIVTTERGVSHVKSYGLETMVIQLEETGFYKGL